MSYDSKSNVGQFIANQSNSNDNQLTIFENKTADIQVPLRSNKEVELLSMDQFGWNSSILRKDHSIINADGVNSDKEYGILQAENLYSFNLNKGIDIVDDGLTDVKKGWVVSYPPLDVSSSLDLDKPEVLESSKGQDAECSGAFLIPYVQVCSDITGKRIVNAQHIHLHGGTTTHKYENTDLTSQQMEPVLNQLDADGRGTVKNIIRSFHVGGYQVTWMKYLIKNNSRVRFRIYAATADPDWHHTTGWIEPGETIIFDSGEANTARMEGWSLSIQVEGGVRRYFSCYWEATLMKNLSFKMAEWYSTGWSNSVLPGFSGFKVPAFDMLITHRSHVGGTETRSFSFSDKSEYGYYDVSVGNTSGKVLDYSYLQYFIGQYINESSAKY